MNQLCGSRSSPTWLRARLSATCAWWTCTPSAVFPTMPARSLAPSSDQELLWAQLKIFPTGNQNCHGICAFIFDFIHFSANLSGPLWLVHTHFDYSVCRRGNLPWLYYGDEPGLASRVLQTEAVPIRFSFRGKPKVSNEQKSSLRYPNYSFHSVAVKARKEILKESCNKCYLTTFFGNL